jgi:hypothetical protein
MAREGSQNMSTASAGQLAYDRRRAMRQQQQRLRAASIASERGSEPEAPTSKKGKKKR